jgi:hypothetical protein
MKLPNLFGRQVLLRSIRLQRLPARPKQTVNFTGPPGYLYASLRDKGDKERQRLEKDAELARGFGFDATFVEHVPFANRPGVRFAYQAKLQE